MTNEALNLTGTNKTEVPIGASLSYVVQNKYNHLLYYRESGTSDGVSGFIKPSDRKSFDANYEFWYTSAIDSDTFTNFVNREDIPLISMSYNDAIAKNLIAGARIGQAVGEMHNVAVPVTGYDVSELGVATIPTPDIANGETMVFKSTSIEDNPTGAGIREVTIKYIDPIDKTLKGIILPTNGTDDTVIPVDISFVADFYASKNAIVDGEPSTAAGDISICRQGAPTRQYCIIKTGGNKSFTMSRYIPEDKDYYLRGYVISGNTKGVDVRLRATVGDDGAVVDGWLFKLPLTIGDTAIPIALCPPLVFPGGSRIKVTVYGDVNQVDVSAFINGTLEPKTE